MSYEIIIFLRFKRYNLFMLKSDGSQQIKYDLSLRYLKYFQISFKILKID